VIPDTTLNARFEGVSEIFRNLEKITALKLTQED
jgi:hypothetical protein